MEKIINHPKINIYGGASMINKYIFMKRDYELYKELYIYQIKDIIKNIYPVTYKCNKLNILKIYKDDNKKSEVIDNICILELKNNDLLYELNINEFLEIFKVFVTCANTLIKIKDNIFDEIKKELIL